MRWEEIWDAALRIRGAFLPAPLPPELADPILDAYRKLASGPVAVRSSAPGEDGTRGSFAGLHESVTDVTNAQDLLDAVRIVWGSLWSDAALLYRKELGLDVAHGRWKEIYKEKFIPFAHGVIRFGQYYNDAMCPADPFEFVGLLEHQPMMASDRNAALSRLADQVRSHPPLASWLEQPEVLAGVTDRRS
jgi:hypothetical protein